MSTKNLVRKKSSVFAPSEAVQHAKEELGKNFFDLTLMECPQNAKELTKLVQQMKDYDKKKYKVVKEINREQAAVLKSGRESRCRSRGSSIGLANDGCPVENSSLGDENITPGFRFRSNGEPKLKLSSSLLQSTMSGTSTTAEPTEDNMTSSRSDEKSPTSGPAARLNKQKSESMNYKKQINELELIISEIFIDLKKNKAHPSYGNSHMYLRAHSSENAQPVSVPPKTSESHNARFHSQTCQTGDQHCSKKNAKCEQDLSRRASHSDCPGCQFKRLSDIKTRRLKLRTVESCPERRWNYTSNVKSFAKTLPIVDFLRQKSSATKIHEVDKPHSHSLKERKKSAVRFADDNTSSNEDIASSRQLHQRAKSELAFPGGEKNTIATRRLSTPSLKRSAWTPTPAARSTTPAARSMTPAIASSRSSTLSMNPLDKLSNMNLLKEMQADETKFYDQKVKQFLKKMDEGTTARHTDRPR